MTEKGKQDITFDDVYLLRFLIGSKWKLKDLKNLWDEFLEFRVEYNIPNIMNLYNEPNLEHLLKHAHAGYCGVDKIGRPVYYERY